MAFFAPGYRQCSLSGSEEVSKDLEYLLKTFIRDNDSLQAISLKMCQGFFFFPPVCAAAALQRPVATCRP